MGSISEKTLLDLEFFTILKEVKEFCISDLGKEKVSTLKPIKNIKKLTIELKLTDEYLTSFSNDNKLPNHFFKDITKELHLLGIENSFLEPKSFLKIATNCTTIFNVKQFLKKFKLIYPYLFKNSEKIEVQKNIVKTIFKIITPHAEILDNASALLKKLRAEITYVRSKIDSSFVKTLNRCYSAGYLDDIKESVIDNQRVLAVQAMHRKKVKGSFLGSSKTGSIVYITPESTLQYSRELQNLLYEEKEEVVRILKELTNNIRLFLPQLLDYQNYLIMLDVIAAKAKFAHKINACLPKINLEKRVVLKEAYHPILWLKNTKQNIKTISQDIELNSKQQIIVISGPNAGGKSITLKTIGLLQVMLQSGFLIPVNERSSTCIFSTILTDIGDNQSIENQLSTYSYRLKNMRNFLYQCNTETLFLIDEFGTGSDPELGGALAEIFLEEFYNKNAFGIITTHYANLKVLANELNNVVNANMQFNERTLEPLYKLFIGQAGSSFTFEVAQKNGIPYRLINRAKKRVESEKIRLDKTISKLQKERNKLQKTSENLEKEKNKAVEQTDSLEEQQQKIQQKLERFQELYDNNQKMLTYGRKINDLTHKYFQTNNKKELLKEFNKWLLIEKTKYLKKHPPKPKSKTQKRKAKIVKKEQQEKLKNTEKEVLTKVVKVREEKKKQTEIIAKQKANYTFKINDKVKIIGSNSIGTIEKIEKNKVLINYGVFTTQTSLQKLELVQTVK